MKSIVYRESIQICGHEHIVFEVDYSETIDELIENNFIHDSVEDITNYITDDIQNNMAL